MKAGELEEDDAGDAAQGAEEHGSSAVRLNKYLADHGVASRRACDRLIEEGRVRVNGRVVADLGVRVDPTSDEVRVDEEVLESERKVYYLLYKPKGVVCTSGDAHGRPRAIDLLKPKVRERVYCVGRLDEDSEGLILLTNDGAFAQRVAHPRHQVPKTYHLKVQGAIERNTLAKAESGIHLAEGRTAGAKIKVVRRGATASTLLVTLREGRNRELRRVFARLGHPVKSLVRVRIGNLSTYGLKRGVYRALRRGEIEEMLAFTAREVAPPPPGKRKRSAPAMERKRRASAGKRKHPDAVRPPRPEGRSDSHGPPRRPPKRSKAPRSRPPRAGR